MEIKSDENLFREVREKIEKCAKETVTAHTLTEPVLLPTVIVRSHCSDPILMYECDKRIHEERARKWYMAYAWGEENEYSDRAKENREKYLGGENDTDFRVFLNRLHQYAFRENEGGSCYAMKEDIAINGKYIARYIQSDTLSAAYSIASAPKDEGRNHAVEHAFLSHSVYCLESYILMQMVHGFAAYSLFSEFYPVYHELLDRIVEVRSFFPDRGYIYTVTNRNPYIPDVRFTFSTEAGLFSDMECFIPALKSWMHTLPRENDRH